jgi:predicted metal-binding membrane protein
MQDAQSQSDRTQVRVIIALVVALAWMAFALYWSGFSFLDGLDHTKLAEGGWRDALASTPAFVVAWVIMLAAMMLPTTLPMVLTLDGVARRQQQRWMLSLFVGGYLAAWTAVGLVVYAADFLIHEVVESVAALEGPSRFLGPAAIFAAGAYQLSPLKSTCLSKCRSPLGFFMTRWRDGNRGAVAMGFDHGLFCIGCCWVLMLLMFALGTANPIWMILIALIMFLEKTNTHGELVGKGVAWSFMGMGAVVAALYLL